ncbi:hypothetical protein AOQ84DRAFT_219044 [Glonium stellatum]|uniref:Uncharacterized protein n=1 Tax=Glonium stellatum TaxID=574774 RepID=A0A8E2JLI8_9PEZI|nr:hypothetical protein AOQ84DRAFT_219044 [Glonium stellatum]
MPYSQTLSFCIVAPVSILNTFLSLVYQTNHYIEAYVRPCRRPPPLGRKRGKQSPIRRLRNPRYILKLKLRVPLYEAGIFQ